MRTRSVIGYWAIISTITISFAGCLELGTTTPPEETWSSSSTSSGDVGSSSTSSSSTTTSSTSSSSSSSASSSSGMPAGIIAKSNFGSTLLNNIGAVACGTDMQELPIGGTGEVFECTHISQAKGDFHQGLTATLQPGQTYTFTFFFKGGTFAMPFDQPYTKIGIGYQVEIAVDGAPLVTTTPYLNGWYRQKITFSPGNAPSVDVFFTQSIDQMPGGSYWLYGFQLEEGFTPSDYVP